MIQYIVFSLLLLPTFAYSLDSAEFHLYGINAKDVAFDITPYGDGYTADGDVNEKDGIRGEFSIWVQTKEGEKVEAQPAGNCMVSHVGSYRLSCKPGKHPFSGVLYEGYKLNASDLERNPDARKLYKSFLAKNEYGLMAAYYRCKKGCNASIPATLIFVWRGD